MQHLTVSGIEVALLDGVIIVGYFVLIMLVAVLLSRRASKDLDSYFLGGRTLPWWLLGLSGTACYFDVSGVMWTIGIFYVMGQQFIWPQFMWGYTVMLACFAVFMGKWLRRSKVLTGAEWMVFRFGAGWDGEFARTSYAVMAVVIAIAFTGFAEYGCGAFFSVFVPVPASLAGTGWEQQWPHLLAIALMALTAIYTVTSGMLGVGFTGFIQFLFMMVGSAVLIIQAMRMASYDQIAAEVPPNWFSFWPNWTWPRLGEWKFTASWVALTPIALTWLAKGIALGIGGPQQLYDLQRFLAARSPREASLAGMIWGAGLVPMFMVSSAVATIGLMRWGGEISNPEDLYPIVVGTMLPVGLKGIVLVGLLSAFMSTFSATVNAGASYLTFDLYQKFVVPDATTRHVIRASRIFSTLIVVAGIAVGMAAKDINAIFEWIMMVLGTGVLVPNVLRWFWWRFNGYGFAIGTLVGVLAAVLCIIFLPQAPGHITFPILLVISAVSSIAATLYTPPTDMAVLTNFYTRVQPAGWWKPVRALLGARADIPRDSFTVDVLAAVVTTIAFQALYLISTFAVTHQWQAVGWACITLTFCGVVLYFTWYRRFPIDTTSNQDQEHASVERLKEIA